MAFFRTILKSRKSTALFIGNNLFHDPVQHNIRGISKSAGSFYGLQEPIRQNNINIHSQKAHDYITFSQISQLFQEVKIRERLSSYDALFLLRSCGNSCTFEDATKRSELTKDVWELIEKYDVAIDVTHINALLQAYIDNKTEINTDEILSLMKAKDIIPNRITYSRFIQSFCQHGNIEGANHILEIMNEEKHAIDKSIFNYLIIGNARAQDLEGALQMLEIMKQKKMVIDNTTFDCLLQVYSEMNLSKEASDLLVEAERENITFSAKVLADSYANFKACENEQIASEIKAMMPSCQLPKTLVTAIQTLISAEQYEAAFNMIQFSEVDRLLCTYFLFQLAAKATMDVTLDYCEKIHSKQIMNPYGRMLIHYASSGQHQNIFKILSEMKRNDVDCSVSLFIRAIRSMDSTKPSFLFNVTQLLKLCTLSVPYLDIFALLDMSNPHRTLKYLNNNLMSNNQRNLNCFLYLVLENRMEEAFTILSSIGGFRHCYPYIIQKMSEAYSTLPLGAANHYAKFMVILNGMKRQNRSVVYSPSVAGLLSGIDFALAKTNFSDAKEQMYLLLKAMETYGINTSTEDVAFLKSICSCLSADSEELLDQMIIALPTKEHDHVFLAFKDNYNVLHSEGLSREMTETEKLRIFNSNFLKKHYLRAEDQFKFMRNPPSSAKLDMARIYNLKGNFAAAEHLISALISQGVSIPTSGKVAYIKNLLSAGKIDDALQLLPEIENFRFDVPVIVQMITEISKLPDSEKLLEFKAKLFQDQRLSEAADIYSDIKGNNLEQALEKMKAFHIEHHSLIWTLQFFEQCIDSEQPDIMQQLHEFIIEKAGKVHSLQSMGIAFLYKKKYVQSLRVFQSLGSTVQNFFFLKLSKEHQLKDNADILQDLLQLCVDLGSPDMTEVYQTNIHFMIRSINPEKALELWTEMQNNNLQISPNMAYTLGKFLQQCNIKVPFVFSNYEVHEQDTQINRKSMKDIIDEMASSNLSDLEKVRTILDSRYKIDLETCFHVFFKNILNGDNVIDIFNILPRREKMSRIVFLTSFEEAKKANKQEEFVLAAAARKPIFNLPIGALQQCIKDTLELIPQALEKIEDEANENCNPILLSALFNHYLLEENTEKADFFFDKCKSSTFLRIDPDTISKYCNEEKSEIIKKYFENMDPPRNFLTKPNLSEEGNVEKSIQDAEDNKDDISLN